MQHLSVVFLFYYEGCVNVVQTGFCRHHSALVPIGQTLFYWPHEVFLFSSETTREHWWWPQKASMWSPPLSPTGPTISFPLLTSVRRCYPHQASIKSRWTTMPGLFKIFDFFKTWLERGVGRARRPSASLGQADAILVQNAAGLGFMLRAAKVGRLRWLKR